MERDGLIVLPSSQRRSTRVLRPVISRDRTAAVPGPRPSCSSAAYPSTKEGKLWNAGRYHYLGFTPMPGSQHFVRSAEGEPLAVLGFGAAEDRTASSWERRQRTFRRQQREVGSESNISHVLAQAMFARRPPLRSASSTARDLLRKPRGNLLPCSQPGSAKHRAAASST